LSSELHTSAPTESADHRSGTRPDDWRHVLAIARAMLVRMLDARPPVATPRVVRGVANEEVAAWLATSTANAAADDRRDTAVRDAMRALVEEANSDAPTSRTAQIATLASTLRLIEIDVAIVVALLAPEIDPGCERAYAFAWDDFTKKRPDVGFLAALAGGPTHEGCDQVLRRLQPSAPLRRNRVVVLGSSGDPAPLNHRPIRLADRIVSFLRGHADPDETILGFASFAHIALRTADLVMPPEVIASARVALGLQAWSPSPARVAITGRPGSGRAVLANALCDEARVPVLRVDFANMCARPDLAPERWTIALREAALARAACLVDGVGDVDPTLASSFVSSASVATVPIIFVCEKLPAWLRNGMRDVREVAVPPPGYRARVELWRRSLGGVEATTADIETTAARYAFTGGTIAIASSAARNIAALHGRAATVTLSDLTEAARGCFGGRLGEVAQRIPPGFKWDDLVLPDDVLELLHEVVRFARLRAFLLEEWGFNAKLPYGRGISAILAGPPGTGKTMVAQLLAHELGYDLYRIDLSQVVNKYIGETEKNLARIFDEAENSHAVLFFDEADALFAKRTDVKSSNDRYANLEVNYLLQRMETYDGVTLLATNLEQGLDPAFKRRVRFSIAFEMPDAEQRERLWRSMFPPEVPLARDIDWEQIAERFEMAGGYIKKAALRAALMAAGGDQPRPITTDDLVRAAVREYREMGRIISG
jgi:ATP-dependent 26S proteasome regulatory subunit